MTDTVNDLIYIILIPEGAIYNLSQPHELMI